MKLTGIHIKNFKAIHEMKIDSIENALILVGQNNTGKTTILEGSVRLLEIIIFLRKILTVTVPTLRWICH